MRLVDAYWMFTYVRHRARPAILPGQVDGFGAGPWRTQRGLYCGCSFSDFLKVWVTVWWVRSLFWDPVVAFKPFQDLTNAKADSFRTGHASRF